MLARKLASRQDSWPSRPSNRLGTGEPGLSAITLRLPAPLLDALRVEAGPQGISAIRVARNVLENAPQPELDRDSL